MKNWLKLFFHSFWNTFTRPSEAHQICTSFGSGQPRGFCECGYLNKGKTWDEEVRDLQEAIAKLEAVE